MSLILFQLYVPYFTTFWERILIFYLYEADPLICPHCQGQMRIIAFITNYPVVDRILNHLKLTFVADKPPPAQVAYQELLMPAEASGEYFS